MERYTWDIYKAFRCVAEKCPDSCCQGWEVDVDETSADRYRALEGALGDRLRQVMKTVDGETTMILENGRCPMWRQDGLCRIQAELNHDALCQVCQEYPRLRMDFGNFAEWGLELSCPEAARLIFQSFEVQKEILADRAEAEYDGELMAILRESRRELLDFWHHTECTVPEKLAVTLMFAHQTQDALDGGEYLPLNWRKLLSAAESYVQDGDFVEILHFFEGLEILTDSWRHRLLTPEPGSWELQHLAIYLIHRYWLQAVWDYELVCRVKFIVSACILVNGLGGDPVQTSQLFSKEIENDPDNREAILDAAYTHRAFTDVNLLSLLLGNEK